MASVSRRQAGAAGILYLVTHVTSVTAVIAYGAGAVRVGVALELVLSLGCLGTGALLWILLRAHGPTRAVAFALLRCLEASVIVAGSLPMLASVLDPSVAEGSAEAVHAAAFLLGQGLVISVNTIVLGWLLWDSRLVPRALAALGVAGGAIVLTSNAAQLAGVIPLNGALAGAAAVPIFAFEVWLAVLLIVTGLRPRGAANRSSDISIPRAGEARAG